MVLRIKDFTASADTSDDGTKILPHVEALFRREGVVVVSFHGINTATSSFVNAAFVPLIETFGIADIKKRLRVVDSTRQINEMVRTRLLREAERIAMAA